MSLHFDIKEFRKRLNRLLELMEENDLDGMLLFRQESIFLLRTLTHSAMYYFSVFTWVKPGNLFC